MLATRDSRGSKLLGCPFLFLRVSQARDQEVSAIRSQAIRISYPKGLLRLALRAPILVYRLGLGWILGNRFLLLEHRGRRSGKLRRTVLEVVSHDLQEMIFVVVSAWGKRADWYQNICANPNIHIVVGSSTSPAVANIVSRDEALGYLRDYGRRHPWALRHLGSRLIGRGIRDPSEIIDTMAQEMPLVKLSAAEGEVHKVDERAA